MNRVSTCHFLFQRYEKDFLKKLVTGDEICTKICIENALDLRANRSSTIAKSGVHSNKVLLFIWGSRTGKV